MSEKETFQFRRAIIIKNIIISWYGCDTIVFEKRSRKGAYVRIRQVTAYCLCRYCNKLQLQTIGELIGGYNHATVLHSKKSIQNLIDSNKEFRDKFQQLIDIISKSMLDLQLNGEAVDHNDYRVASLIGYSLWLSNNNIAIVDEDSFYCDKQRMTSVQIVTKYLSET